MSLEEISNQVIACKKCRLYKNAKHGVPGEGHKNARIMIVGQNPGAEEDETGKPFVGRAGKFLTESLMENGLKREEIFVTNIVKHKTPKNRRPFADEIAACLPYLLMQISIVKPEKILLLGKVASKTPRAQGIKYFEIVHPQAASRFPEMRKKFRRQIKEVQMSL
jgi:uracil-DNA glycosylase